jgi:hypothetical protein
VEHVPERRVHVLRVEELQELFREDDRLTNCLTQVAALLVDCSLSEEIELLVRLPSSDNASHLVELPGASHGEYL